MFFILASGQWDVNVIKTVTAVFWNKSTATGRPEAWSRIDGAIGEGEGVSRITGAQRHASDVPSSAGLVFTSLKQSND
jgi:hypothetical protein